MPPVTYIGKRCVLPSRQGFVIRHSFFTFRSSLPSDSSLFTLHLLRVYLCLSPYVGHSAGTALDKKMVMRVVQLAYEIASPLFYQNSKNESLTNIGCLYWFMLIPLPFMFRRIIIIKVVFVVFTSSSRAHRAICVDSRYSCSFNLQQGRVRLIRVLRVIRVQHPLPTFF